MREGLKDICPSALRPGKDSVAGEPVWTLPAGSLGEPLGAWERSIAPVEKTTGKLRCRLVELGEVGELGEERVSDSEGMVTAGERGCAALLGLDVGTARSRDEMGEGGEDSYTAQSCRCADLP